MFTTAGLICSATSAKFTSVGAVIAARVPPAVRAGGAVREFAGAGVSDPATMRPTRNAAVATSTTVTSAKRRLISAL